MLTAILRLVAITYLFEFINKKTVWLTDFSPAFDMVMTHDTRENYFHASLQTDTYWNFSLQCLYSSAMVYMYIANDN